MKLFTPIKIGKMELKNRIVMPAIITHYASENGQVTERMIRYYERRAKGGVGLLIVESANVRRDGKCYPLMLNIDTDESIRGLKKLAEVIKRHGANVAIQIMHGGVSASAKLSHMQPVGPSDYPAYPAGMGPAPRALTVEEIRQLVLAFRDAARRAKEAGFDAIVLHCSHSYGIDQFMSPLFNKRKDMYGGNIRNRARFACEIMESMKENVGKDYPIICRMSGDDGVEGGNTLEDAKLIAGFLVSAGADALSISAGRMGNLAPIASLYFPYGNLLHLSEGIKKAVNVSVIAAGKINTPEFAEQVLNEGKADLVAMGRALFADPDLPRKAKDGKTEAIIPCIYCNQGCLTRLFNGLDIRCLVNPAAGREAEFEIEPVGIPKKVLILGGGPAGLEAAIMARRKGHDVFLVEKENSLGGQLNIASKPPSKEVIKKLIDYFSYEMRNLGIKISLGKRATKEFVNEIKPDVVIMAMGANPIFPETWKEKGENILLAKEVLEGKKVLGEKVVVIGGGQVGLETAEVLADAGKEVTVLEMLSEAGTDMSPREKMFLVKRLSGKKAQVFVNRKVKEVLKRSVYAEHVGQQEEFIGDAIVVAVGSNPNRGLLDELNEIIQESEFYMVGDCIEPRKAIEAIYEGARVGNEI